MLWFIKMSYIQTNIRSVFVCGVYVRMLAIVCYCSHNTNDKPVVVTCGPQKYTALGKLPNLASRTGC